jgi:hypothetical protein
VTYPGTEFTADKTWTCGGTTAVSCPRIAVREPVGSLWPDQGSVIVGTDGMLVLPHGSAQPFVLPVEKTGQMPMNELQDRDHYAEFIDAALAGGSARCSADFSYAGR